LVSRGETPKRKRGEGNEGRERRKRKRKKRNEVEKNGGRLGRKKGNEGGWNPNFETAP